MRRALRWVAAGAAYAALVAGWYALRAPREVVLPDGADWLVREAAAARDAPALLMAFRARGYGSIRVTGPLPPGLPWSALSSAVWTDFWELYVHPTPLPSPQGGLVRRISVLPLAPRRLSLGEPPGLPEMGAPGGILLKARRPREALEAFRSARARAPAVPALMGGEAAALLALKRPREAAVLLWRAIQVSAPEPLLFEGLSKAFTAMGRKAEAARALEQAAGLDYTNPALWKKAAGAWREAGDVAGEARCLEAASSLGGTR